MKSVPGNLAAAVAVWVLFGASLLGQVVPVQSGRLLDKNPQVGSGGLNAPTGGQGGVNNQLYNSGALQGYTSQIANGQLLDRNPQLGSTGYNSVTGGVGGVSSQLLVNRASTGTLAFRGDVPYVALREVQTGGAGLAGPTGLQTALRSGEPYAAGLNEVFSQYSSFLQPQGGGAAAPQAGAARAPDLANLFTSGASGDLSAMAQRLFGPAPVAEPDQLGQMRISGHVDSQIYAQIDNRIDAQVPAKAPATQPQAAPAAAAPGADVTLDILMLLARQKETVAAAAQAPTAAPAAPQRKDNAPVAIVNDEVIVRGLGGMGKTLFDRYMLQGQELLKAGKYYSAASAYENAAILQSGDPMPFIGWGLSLLGAGEPLAGGERLKIAVRVFPPLMKTRIDAAAMMDARLLDKRLAEISRRVTASRQNEGTLAFVLTFLGYNLHRDTDARFFAARLRVDAGDDPVFSGYAAFVLGEKTGQTPASAPARRP